MNFAGITLTLLLIPQNTYNQYTQSNILKSDKSLTNALSLPGRILTTILQII